MKIITVADRIQARAIRRCGELLKQVEARQGANQNIRDCSDMKVLTRTDAATQAGLSERQKVTALRVATSQTFTPVHPHAHGKHRASNADRRCLGSPTRARERRKCLIESHSPILGVHPRARGSANANLRWLKSGQVHPRARGSAALLRASLPPF